MIPGWLGCPSLGHLSHGIHDSLCFGVCLIKAELQHLSLCLVCQGLCGWQGMLECGNMCGGIECVSVLVRVSVCGCTCDVHVCHCLCRWCCVSLLQKAPCPGHAQHRKAQAQQPQASRAVPGASPPCPQDKRVGPTSLSHLCHDKQSPVPQHSTQYVLSLSSTQKTQSPL